MSALNAPASTFSPSWMSIARLVFPSRLELKSLAGSFNEAPLANVSFTTDLYVSPVQMIPSCDHVGVPGFVDFTHFTSSTTSGSASLMSLRILLKVSPRQSPSSAILLSIRSDADWPSLESDSFMFSSRNFQSPECLQTTHSNGVTSPRRQRNSQTSASTCLAMTACHGSMLAM